MIENDLLKNTSDDIAQFLYKGEGLNKTAIGDYLGERSGWGWLLFRLAFSIESHQHPSMCAVRASDYWSIFSISHSGTHPSFPKRALLLPRLDHLHKKSPLLKSAHLFLMVLLTHEEHERACV